jgi:SOS response regulatory protein OraA/RecX
VERNGIEAVLTKLRELKLLDDAQFAANWVENRSQFKPKGARMLQQELRMKGVGREEIESALPDAETEIENALLALEKLERKLASLEGREREQKAIELLARRGFGYGAAKAAIQRQANLSTKTIRNRALKLRPILVDSNLRKTKMATKTLTKISGLKSATNGHSNGKIAEIQPILHQRGPSSAIRHRARFANRPRREGSPTGRRELESGVGRYDYADLDV